MKPNYRTYDITPTLHGSKSFHLGTTLLASADLKVGLGKVGGVINAIALLLFFGGMVLSAMMFMIGRTEYMKYALVGAGVGALSWTIISAFFAAGSLDPGIQLQDF